MRGGAIALALLAWAPAVAAQPAGNYDAAVAARRSGDNAGAIRLLEPIVRAEPANADAQVQLGYAYLALDRLDDAGRAFQQALATAPAYADARLGLARVAERRGDRDGARRLLAPLDPADPDVRALQARLAGATDDARETRWSLDADLAYAFVDGPQPDWREGALQVRRRFTPSTAGTARVEGSRRFGVTDIYGEARIEQALGGAQLYLTLGGTPDADFRPRWQVGAGGSLRLTGGTNATVLTLDARHAAFVAGDVRTVSPGVEQYFAGGRIWLTARWINLFDQAGTRRSGYFLRGDAQAGDGLRLFAGFSDAPDTAEGIVIPTRSYFGGISVALGARATARFNVAFEDRETGADRTQVGIGLGWRL